jgi:hypothetical protein
VKEIPIRIHDVKSLTGIFPTGRIAYASLKNSLNKTHKTLKKRQEEKVRQAMSPVKRFFLPLLVLFLARRRRGGTTQNAKCTLLHTSMYAML